jgi:hypothetical protein
MNANFRALKAEVDRCCKATVLNIVDIGVSFVFWRPGPSGPYGTGKKARTGLKNTVMGATDVKQGSDRLALVFLVEACLSFMTECQKAGWTDGLQQKREAG